jgi:hypothetical protein
MSYCRWPILFGFIEKAGLPSLLQLPLAVALAVVLAVAAAGPPQEVSS